MNKINLCWRVPMDTEISILTTVPKNFFQNTENNSFNVQKRKETYNFLRKKISSKYSSGQLESSFQNPADIFLTKGR